MPLKCMLGVVACLHFNGEVVTAQTAVDVIDLCEVVKEMPLSEFGDGMDYGRGSASADLLYDKGMKFRYQKNSSNGSRKATVVKACREFHRDFNDDSKWDNLDKWPWK